MGAYYMTRIERDRITDNMSENTRKTGAPNPYTSEGYAERINPATPEGRAWLATYLSTMVGLSTPQQVAIALETPLGKIAINAVDPEMRMHILEYAGMAGRSAQVPETNGIATDQAPIKKLTGT